MLKLICGQKKLLSSSVKCFCSSAAGGGKISSRIQSLVGIYEDIRRNPVKTTACPHVSSSNEIFANNQLQLSQIDVVGFDYDYTLCHYTEELQHLIYDMARDHLVDRFRYPSEMTTCTFDPDFAIRGLIIDAEKGLLCKMSSHQKLAYHGVYRGTHRLTKEEVLDEYNGSRHIPISYRDEKMKPLNDLFSVSHASLFADVIQFFIDKDIEYEPHSVFEDIDAAISFVHESGKMHKAVAKDLPRFVEPSPNLRVLLERMKKNGKKLFLCTNSSFRYADAGLKFMIGDNWADLFDLVIASAKKPDFYTRDRAFRLFDSGKRRVKWQVVKQLDPNSIYTQGSLRQLMKMKKWNGRRVLYIGDSLFSDLVEPNRIQGWRTGAIIRELESEMTIQNSPEYQQLVYQMHALEEVLRRLQFEIGTNASTEEAEVLSRLVDEHEDLQFRMGKKINKNFGSVFRVESHPSQFASSVQRYVDIYASRLENFLDYSEEFTFYPQHTRLPHEPKNEFFRISQRYDEAIKQHGGS